MRKGAFSGNETRRNMRNSEINQRNFYPLSLIKVTAFANKKKTEKKLRKNTNSKKVSKKGKYQ